MECSSKAKEVAKGNALGCEKPSSLYQFNYCFDIFHQIWWLSHSAFCLISHLNTDTNEWLQGKNQNHPEEGKVETQVYYCLIQPILDLTDFLLFKWLELLSAPRPSFLVSRFARWIDLTWNWNPPNTQQLRCLNSPQKGTGSSSVT